MKSEHEIQKEIMLAVSPDCCIFRTNAGRFWQGKVVYSKEFGQNVLINIKPIEGLPQGYTDLSGVRKSDGKAVFIEVKREDGKLRPEQERFINAMRANHALAGVARSKEEALRIIWT